MICRRLSEERTDMQSYLLLASVLLLLISTNKYLQKASYTIIYTNL
jgi:hypothetical protein